MDQGVGSIPRAFNPLHAEPRMIHLQGDTILVSTEENTPATPPSGLDFRDPGVVRLVTTTRFGNIATPVDATDVANKDYVDRLSRPFVITKVIAGRPQKIGDAILPLGVTLSATREMYGTTYFSDTHPQRESSHRGRHRRARGCTW